MSAHGRYIRAESGGIRYLPPDGSRGIDRVPAHLRDVPPRAVYNRQIGNRHERECIGVGGRITVHHVDHDPAASATVAEITLGVRYLGRLAHRCRTHPEDWSDESTIDIARKYSCEIAAWVTGTPVDVVRALAGAR